MWSPMGMIYRATYNENESNGELAVGRQVLVVQALVYYDFKRQQSRAMTFDKVAEFFLLYILKSFASSLCISIKETGFFWTQLNTRDTARCRCTKD